MKLLPPERSEFSGVEFLTRALSFARQGDFEGASSRSPLEFGPPKEGPGARAQAVNVTALILSCNINGNQDGPNFNFVEIDKYGDRNIEPPVA